MLAVAFASLAFQAPMIQPSILSFAATRTTIITASVFEDGMSQFKDDYPWLAKYGFGPSVKAERWNGRHAMFGWLAIAATAYAKSNGYFPDPTTALTYKDWGGLAQLGFNEYISNERAIIMIAHVHALTISACAAFGPQVLGDTLTLLDGEEDEVRRPLTIRTCPPCYTTPQHATRHEPVDRSQANHSAGAPIGNGCRVVG